MTRAGIAALAFAMLALSSCEDNPSQPPDTVNPVEAMLETVRAATAAFQSLDAATAAGFAPASECVASPAGGMGIHYANLDRLDGTLDAREPEALLYEPLPGGAMRLVGVEFVVVADPWDAANAAPPVLAGRAFDDHRAADARHGLPFAHYDLHVWAWEENTPWFAPFNASVSCAAAAPAPATRHEH